MSKSSQVAFDELAARVARWVRRPEVFVREELGAEPDPPQEEVLARFPVEHRQAMAASKGTGKAQPIDLMLDTPSGLRRFGDLRVGDEVFGGDGVPTLVTGVFDLGYLPVYEVRFDDGSRTACCGDHLWRVRSAYTRSHEKTLGYRRSVLAGAEIWELLTTEELLTRGVRNKNGRWAGRQFEIPRQGAVEYPAAILPIDAYVLGVWLGDGVRLSGRYATKPTGEIEDEIRRRGYRTSGERGGIVNVYGLAEELRRLGVISHYSHQRYVPAMFRRGSAQQRRDLLCGLMDTDGEIGDRGHMAFSTTSEELRCDVEWLVRSVGGVAVRQKDKEPFYYGPSREKIRGRRCYRLTVRLPFNPFRVPHRRERWKDPMRTPGTMRYISRKIDSIEPVGASECRCIRVAAEDGLYLTNDFIVTHNTTVLAWMIWYFLLTRRDAKVAATSISEDNLRDNLWTELAKWQRKSKLLTALFELSKSRIVCRESPETWWCAARTWSKTADQQQQSATLAGLHAEHLLFVLDESGEIPDAVLASAEAALSTGGDVHILQGGNPTQLSGPLYRAATSEAGLWHTVRMNGDPDSASRSARVDVQWARDQIAKWGRDNPWVLVNVFGQFPPSSINTLIGPDEMAAAVRRSYREHDIAHSARVLGVDVAREGDDASVMFPRQGLVMFEPVMWRNIDGIQGAGAVARKWADWDADACFVDNTGGFGASWIDNLRLLGRSPIPVLFSASPHDARYYNKRAEMYFLLAQWIKEGGQLPDCPELVRALTQITYTFRGDRLLLEEKAQLKERIGMSPDHADAAAETFAEPILARRGALSAVRRSRRPRHAFEYNPYAIRDDERVRG